MFKQTKSSLLSLFLLIILLSAVFISVNAVWSIGTRLTTSPLADFNPSIRQLNNKSVWVVWERAATNPDLYRRIYNQTTATWTTERVLLPPGGIYRDARISPYVIQTHNNTLWVFYAANKTNGHYYDIVYAQTNDYGLTWSQTYHVTDSVNNPQDQYNNKAPSVLEASNGDIWVVWQRTLPANDEIFYRIYRANSWGNTRQLTNSSSVSAKNPSIMQAKNGAIMVYWSQYLSGTQFNIMYEVYTGSWGPVKQLTPTNILNYDPEAVLARTGDIWVVWWATDPTNETDSGNLFYRTSQDNGNNWSSQTQLTADGDSRMPSITQVNDKKIWIAWTMNVAGNPDIYYKTSDPLLYHDVAVTNIALSKTSAYQGSSVLINVTGLNKGDYNENLNAKCYANQTLLGTKLAAALPGGNSTVLSFPWDTTTFAAGNYVMKATVDQVPNESQINLADNTLTSGQMLLRIPGDVTGDGKVDKNDLVRLNLAIGSTPGQSDWDPWSDINGDGIVNAKDLYIVSSNFGKHV